MTPQRQGHPGRPNAISIVPENSAQGTTSSPNPEVANTLSLLEQNGTIQPPISITDLGCGKLRHLSTYYPLASRITLVDTDFQITRIQTFAGQRSTMSEFVDTFAHEHKEAKCTIQTIDQFESSNRKYDICLLANVLDVILPKTRLRLIEAASKALARHGRILIIIPRNDSSITKRCTEENEYSDGHFFLHRNSNQATFYKNFVDHSPIVAQLSKFGLEIEYDLSKYRQVVLVARK